MIAKGCTVLIEKGCQARMIAKGPARVLDVIEGERRSARVRLEVRGGRTLSFYVQHVNRLADPIVSMNDGNPMHRIRVRVLAPASLTPMSDRLASQAKALGLSEVRIVPEKLSCEDVSGWPVDLDAS